MRLVGNLLWLIFGGLIAGLSYLLAGFMLCLTIVGLPQGLRALRLGFLVLMPFGKRLTSAPSPSGCFAGLISVLWLVVAGWSIALTHLLFALMLAPTVIGIPIAVQHLRLLPVALFPDRYRLEPARKR